MWWLVLSISGSIIGSASNSWFKDTKLGVWFYSKLDSVYTYSAKRFNLKILSEEESWKQQHPNIVKELEELNKRIVALEQNKK